MTNFITTIKKKSETPTQHTYFHMHCFIYPLIRMLPGYHEWVQRRQGRAPVSTPTNVNPSTSYVATQPAAEARTSTGVLSYNQMKRLSGGGGRPPSEVGSIRSFKSVQTVEEQVTQLEETVRKLQLNQEETNDKLDQVLKLLSTQSSSKRNQEEKISKKQGYN